MKPQPEGAMCLFTLKNPSFPEYVCITETGVMCVDIHPKHPFLVCIGKYDGNVAVYNVQSPEKVPQYESNSVTNKHRGTVWQVILKQISVCSLSFLFPASYHEPNREHLTILKTFTPKSFQSMQ